MQVSPRKLTHADVRPGLDRPVALRRLVDQQAASLIEGDTVADQGIGNRRIEPELPRRVIDAGDAGPFLGNHPAGDILGSGRGIGGTIGGQNGVRRTAGRYVGRRHRRDGIGILLGSRHPRWLGIALSASRTSAAGVG